MKLKAMKIQVFPEGTVLHDDGWVFKTTVTVGNRTVDNYAVYGHDFFTSQFDFLMGAIARQLKEEFAND